MIIPISGDAPEWAQVFANAIGAAIEEALTRRLPVFTLATLPSATDKRFLWRPIAISNGASNKFVAISNGTAWYYMEGTAV